MKGKALLLVDIQNDFLPGGALAVPNGDEIIPVANEYMALKDPHNEYATQYQIIVGSKDWHPQDHVSFLSVWRQHGFHTGDEVITRYGPQIVWPDHCVESTRGSMFPDALEAYKIHRLVRKGTDRDIDSYSAFFDNGHQKETILNSFLSDYHITHLDVMGLATDYCVKFTVLDALDLGYKVSVIAAGCRAVNAKEGDGPAALAEMTQHGAVII